MSLWQWHSGCTTVIWAQIERWHAITTLNHVTIPLLFCTEHKSFSVLQLRDQMLPGQRRPAKHYFPRIKQNLSGKQNWVQWVYFRLCHRMSRDPSVSARCLCKVQNSRRRSHTCVLWAEHRIRIAIWIHMIYFKHIYSTTIIIIVYSYNYIYIYTHTRTVMDGRMDGQTNSNKIDDIPFPLTRPVWFLVAFCSFHSHMFTKFPLP